MPTSEQENMRVLQDVLQAWDRRDFESVLSNFAEDVEWHAAGPPDILPWAGTHRGRDGWMRWRELLGQTVEYKQFDTLKFVAQGDTIVQFIHAKGVAKGTGRSYDSDIARVWTFREGKVVRVQNFLDTYAYARAIRGS